MNRLLLACQVYCSTYCCIAVLLYWLGPWVDGGWVVGGWRMAARSLPEMAEYRQKLKLPPFVSCFIQGPQESTNKLLPAYQLYCCAYCCTAVLLHCYTAVCCKGLVGGLVEGALRRPWWVGGWPVLLCLFSTYRWLARSPRWRANFW